MKKSTENSSDKIAVERSEGIRRGALVAFTTIMLTIVMTSISGEFFGPKVFVAGEIATQSVVSPRDFVLEDEKGTSRRREDAIKHVRRIFSLQDDSADGVAQELRGLFTSAAELEKLTANATSAAERDKRSEFERQYQIDLVGHEWEVLLDTEQWRQLEQAVLLMIQPLLVKGIVANRSMLREAIEKGGALVRRSSDGTEFNIDSEDAVYDAASAAEALEVRSVGRLVGQSPAFSSLSKKLARRYIKPNIFFNADETRLRLEETLQSVEPIYFKIRRGEIIVRAGDRVTPNQERKLEQLAVLQSGTHPIQAAVAYSILIAIILVTAYLFVSIVNPQFRPTLRDLSLVSFAVIGNFILIRLNLVLGDALNLSFPEIDANSFLLATPFAAGGIILQVMLG
ncbi:MAG: hypothetical protein KDD44_12360, partial [Bdellovibrionales bacterium]|nr:hypothetical protein [Bdellovibrionales bacterium]